MFFNKRTGNIGENIACNYLIKKGFKIVEQNFKNKIGELDIICKDKNDLFVIVEVKMRKNCDFGEPEEAINYRKMNKIKLTAMSYLKYKGLYGNVLVRFDCISIVGDEHDHNIRHIENIF